MNELTIIENGIVPIYMNEKQEQIVDYSTFPKNGEQIQGFQIKIKRYIARDRKAGKLK